MWAEWQKMTDEGEKGGADGRESKEEREEWKKIGKRSGVVVGGGGESCGRGLEVVVIACCSRLEPSVLAVKHPAG